MPSVGGIPIALPEELTGELNVLAAEAYDRPWPDVKFGSGGIDVDAQFMGPSNYAFEIRNHCRAAETGGIRPE